MYVLIYMLYIVFKVGAQKILKSSLVKTVNKNMDRDFITDKTNKLTFDNLFSGI